MATDTKTSCIHIERAPVEARGLTVPCTRKATRECCGHSFCVEHYRFHQGGVHAPPDEDPRRRRRAA